MYVISIGRWSEERWCFVCQVDLSAMSGVQKEMSGEVCCVLALKGLRVGECVSFSMLWVSKCCRRAVALVSVCWVVSHAGSCALKSPRIYALGMLLMWLKFGEYPWGVETGGGMYMLRMFIVCLCN